MPIFSWRPGWDSFRDLERHVDQLLESMRIPFPALRVQRQFPPCNLYDLGHELLLTSELPGVRAEDLDLSVANGVLTLRGERTPPAEVSEDHFRRRERIQGSWQRSIPLPVRVATDRVSAEFVDGVLRVHLPKADEVKPRQIPITLTS